MKLAIIPEEEDGGHGVGGKDDGNDDEVDADTDDDGEDEGCLTLAGA